MLKWMRWGAALALAMAGGQAMATAAQPSEDQVRQLLDVVGVGKMLAQMNSQAMTTLQQSMPCVSPDFWQNYMDANQTQLFIGRLVPVYQRHFTADELEGLLKFYRSPLGQKVVNEMPLTMAEANQAGQQWSHERSEQMISELKQMGSLDASGRCPAKVAASPVIGAAAIGGAAAVGAAHVTAEEEGGEVPAKASSSKAPPKSKAPVHKAPAKPAPKKSATTSKAPAKTEAKPAAKAPAKTETKAPAKTETKPASTTPAQGGSATGQ